MVNMTGAQVKPLVTGIGASKALDLLNAKPSSVGSLSWACGCVGLSGRLFCYRGCCSWEIASP